MGESFPCTRHPENPSNGIRCSACLKPFCRPCLHAVEMFFVCRECGSRAPRAVGPELGAEVIAEAGPPSTSPFRLAVATPEPVPAKPDASTKAPLSARIVALIIDVAVMWFGVSLIGFGDESGAFLWMVALAVGYEALFVQEKGQTIGKAIVGIEVVALDGTRATPSRVWLRAVVKVVQFSCGGATFLLVPLVADRRGLHDLAAGTKVMVKTAESHRESNE